MRPARASRMTARASAVAVAAGSSPAVLGMQHAPQSGHGRVSQVRTAMQVSVVVPVGSQRRRKRSIALAHTVAAGAALLPGSRPCGAAPWYRTGRTSVQVSNTTVATFAAIVTLLGATSGGATGPQSAAP